MGKGKKIPFLVAKLLRKFTIIFSLTILVITIVGTFVNQYDTEAGKEIILFALAGALQYEIILQIAGFALIMAIFSVLLFSEYFQTKMRFFFRILLLLLSTLVTTSVFVLIFKWFLPHNFHLWLIFVLCTVICFSISFSLTVFKLKLEEKKYARLLSNYKLQRRIN